MFALRLNDLTGDNMNELKIDEDRQWLKHLVRVLVRQRDQSLNSKKRSLRIFRQNHIDATGVSEKDADSTIEGALAEFSCKIQKRLSIKKPY